MLKRLFAAAAVACLLAACQTAPGSSAGWGQIATGVGIVIGETKIDPQIERISTKLADHCTTVQTAALAVDFLAPEKLQRAAQDARIVIASFCASPPRSVANALASLAAAYDAIEAARSTQSKGSAINAPRPTRSAALIQAPQMSEVVTPRNIARTSAPHRG